MPLYLSFHVCSLYLSRSSQRHNQNLLDAKKDFHEYEHAQQACSELLDDARRLLDENGSLTGEPTTNAVQLDAIKVCFTCLPILARI